MPQKRNYLKIKYTLSVFILLALLGGAAWTSQIALANNTAKPVPQASPLHPPFPMLDEQGENVLQTGSPVSTMQTCGACHDTAFIAEHSFHATVGLNALTPAGETPSNRPWDISPGVFGKWNPVHYRYLSPQGDDLIDLGTAAWIQEYGPRHVGGGPAVYGRDGQLLTDLQVAPGDPETNIIDPATGELTLWDWQASGTVEMNCFLCHTPAPNNDARIQTLQDGAFAWANTATLIGTGIVEQTGGQFQWNPDAFTEEGEIAQETIAIQDPDNDNCGLCHGLVHDDVEDPLVMTGCAPERWRTVTTGQIISPQRMADSGMNLADKESLDRSWDIHAERLVECTDCHFSLNNPVYYQESAATQPDHLLFDPRRIEIGEYLARPLHQFARGDSAQTAASAGEPANTMRRCDSCHSIETTHEWLPYKDRHVNALSCETCHIPKMYSSAFQQFDWTVIHPDGTANSDCRGVEGERGTIGALLTGYAPVQLPRENVDGSAVLAPYNMLTTWFWVQGDPPRPVRLRDLEAAYLENGDYHPGILLRFDSNEDGTLDDTELVIDTPEKETFVAKRLALLGLDNPRIVGEIQPYSINHTVTNGEWATKECQACHSENSQLTQPIMLATYLPGGAMPAFVQDAGAKLDGELYTTEDGALYYRPAPEKQGLYILGRDSVRWVDIAGAVFFVGTLLGIVVHGGLRFYAALRTPQHAHKTEHVYMYSVYERLWHWLQTAAIMALLFTGLVIHKPDTFGAFSFRYVVQVHNVLAAILLINAALSLFYHLASGEIQQYIPRPKGFFDQAITQTLFYVRGIFKNEEHPFEKTPEKKLNPLQQVTYFGILNVLLPLQIITGALMWGVQRWPDTAARLGGLPFLAPFHTLIAWLFATFIVMHVYLTTTGHTPLAGIQSMIMGWDDVEVHASGDG